MAPSLKIDHLVVTCASLEEGVAHVEAALGMTPNPGGVHAGMGSHNALLPLGDIYLEIIAPDPNQPEPARARMFNLNNFSGAPRLSNWVASVSDIEAAVAMAPAGVGPITAASRGDLSWQLTIPEDGKLPFDGVFPALIQWPEGVHPAKRMVDMGCRFVSWTISHPDTALRAALDAYDTDLGASVVQGPLGFSAVIDTPNGPRTLT